MLFAPGRTNMSVKGVEKTAIVHKININPVEWLTSPFETSVIRGAYEAPGAHAIARKPKRTGPESERRYAVNKAAKGIKIRFKKSDLQRRPFLFRESVMSFKERPKPIDSIEDIIKR